MLPMGKSAELRHENCLRPHWRGHTKLAEPSRIPTVAGPIKRMGSKCTLLTRIASWRCPESPDRVTDRHRFESMPVATKRSLMSDAGKLTQVQRRPVLQNLMHGPCKVPHWCVVRQVHRTAPSGKLI